MPALSLTTFTQPPGPLLNRPPNVRGCELFMGRSLSIYVGHVKKFKGHRRNKYVLLAKHMFGAISSENTNLLLSAAIDLACHQPRDVHPLQEH
eukprot:scaffold673137_cov62-Prasinocladus_malaysianus.AAC.1